MTQDNQFYVSNVSLNAAYIKWYSEIEQAEADGKEIPPIPDEIVDAIIKICNKLSFSLNFIKYSYKDEMIADAILECIENVRCFNPNKVLRKLKLSQSSGLEKGDVIVGQTSNTSGKIKYINSKTGLTSMTITEGDFVEGEDVKCGQKVATILEIKDHKANNPFSYITTTAFNAYLIRIDKEKRESYVKSKIVTETPMHEFLETGCHEDDSDFKNSYIEFLRDAGYNDDNMPMSIKRSLKKKAALLEEELVGPLDEFEG